jgi:DNA-binding transcriptional ArsR family regulator
MPGGRLTHDDRRQIAAWLADGHGFAEIARRLGRPTSTISREVARNSPPGDYAPDRAQRVAEGRARRRKAPMAAVPVDREPGFVDWFATLLAGTGLPRMGARVFACLLTCDSGSLTAGELVGRLRVSPASISKAIGYLESMELVVRQPDPRSRRERYAIVDDVWLRAWRADTGAHAEVAAAAQRGAQLFGTGTPAGARLQKMGEFFAWLTGQMDDSGLTDAVVQDALTVLAGLVHAARPLGLPSLATALGWDRARVTDALEAIDRRPVIADPLAVVSTRSGTYSVTVKPDRLTPAQRQALG